ncbi:Mov34/MPN/PAD-1 family protein [Enterovibrio norvegicus]|uniref:CBASS system CD-NTase/cGAS isopeptidase Cap3 n=1 Tax=Enterovibrio norvegicus TaxID=188144 RepID=UPI0013D779EC|nr:Mov34/MPN/PAD-1 family protein [Enterovibrio norvegicus]
MNNDELTYKDSDGSLVVIMQAVHKLLRSYRQLESDSTEAAGVLIGERRGRHIVICDMSEPGKGDIRNRFGVNRKGLHHQAKVDLVFERSDGAQQYLGEWHTHPENLPSPSSIDENSWRLNLANHKPMILLIVGREGLWIAKQNGNVISPLTMME